MARSLPKVCPFLVTVDLKLKWPELPVARITPSYLTETRIRDSRIDNIEGHITDQVWVMFRVVV